MATPRGALGKQMKKSECEDAFQQLFSDWGTSLSETQLSHPSYYAFKHWVQSKGYSRYFNFRSRMGADYDVELWFDIFFKQTWRR